MSTRARHRRDAAAGRRPSRLGRWILGAAASLLAVVAVAAIVTVRGQASPTPADFAMTAYQGRDALGGTDVQLSDLLGDGRPLVVNFWASSCPPCRLEMPGFQRVYDAHGGAFDLVGVDVGAFTGLGTRDGALALIAEMDIRYPTAYARDDAAVRGWELYSMPTTLFFSGDGRLVDRHTGYLAEDAFRARVDGLLASAR
jgi:thiol-disulfide isomerase/thioredoxin